MAMAMAGASTSLITPCLPSNPQISSAGSVFRSGHLGNVLFLRSGPVVRALPRSRLVVSAKIREIFMPALSSTMTEGKIVSWIKSEGEKLAKGDSVVVVESDKADMDVETFYDGYLAAIMVGEGEVAPVGAAIALLAEKEEEIAEAKSKASSAPTSQTTPVEESSPKVEENVSIPAPSPTPTPAALPKPATVVQPIVASTHPASEGGTRIVATPYAKKLAKEYGIDLRTVAGTGPQGRVVANDVEAAVVRAGTAVETSPSPVPAVVKKESPLTSSVFSVSGSEAAFSGMQAAVACNMVESLAVPVFRVGYTINTDAIDALYKKIKSKGVTMSALLAKAAALALVQHPVVNASCKDGKAFVYNASINIAVAVAIDGGLITPVLKDADKVDIYSLSKAWKELVDKARMKQLQPHEYSTGTFTLSNLGMFGVDRFDAILPPGSGAIMAVGASRQTVVASKDGFFGVKNQMQVNVTADHRIIYGADLAAFLQTFAKLVEEPSSLTL